MNRSLTINSSVLYVLADRICDYVPVVSTVVNLYDLFTKYTMISERDAEASMDPYTVYIQRKSFFRCITLLIPVIGNLSIAVYDLILFVYTITPAETLSHRRDEDRIHFENVRVFSTRARNDNTSSSSETIYQEINRSMSFKKIREDSDIQTYQHVIKQVARIRDCCEKLTVNFKEDPSFKFYRQGFRWREQDLCWFDPNKEESLPGNSSSYIRNTIENLMRFRKSLYALDYNGYTVSGRNTYTRFTSLSEVAYSPGFFTGILGLEAGSISQPQIPSWNLVEILLDITDQITIATDVERLQESNFSLKHRPLFVQTKQKVVELCKEMKEHYHNLIPLFGFFATNLVELNEVHRAFSQKMQKNREKHDALSLEDAYYSSFTEFDWGALRKNLVADRKFFLKSTYSDGSCSQVLTPMSQRLTRVCEQSEWVYGEGAASCFIYGMTGYLTMGPYGASMALIPAAVAQLEVDSLKQRWEQEISKIQSLRELLDKPHLKSFYAEGFGQHFVHRSHLILNMTERKIEWIENPLPSQAVLADIDVLPGAPEMGLFVKTHLLFKNAVFDRIESQTLPSAEYRNSVIRLIDAYHECLRKKVENQEIDSTYVLYSLNDGVIVCGEERGAIPLILPKNLMLGLEKGFSGVQRDLMHTGQAGLVPVYTFSTDEGKLRIVFKASDLVVGTAVIAEFDPMTVRSFQSDLISSSQSFDPSEFLLQALYGAMINQCLGLPGCGSFALSERDSRANRQFLAPQEKEFSGCYRLWEAHPNQVITYNSANYDREAASLERITSQKLQVVPTAYYSELVTELYNIKHCQIGEKLEYERFFLILQGLTTLLSAIEWKEVRKILEERWGLVPPDKLYDFEQPPIGLPNLDLVEAQALQDELLANSSERVRVLQQKIEKFDRIIAMSDTL